MKFNQLQLPEKLTIVDVINYTLRMALLPLVMMVFIVIAIILNSILIPYWQSENAQH